MATQHFTPLAALLISTFTAVTASAAAIDTTTVYDAKSGSAAFSIKNKGSYSIASFPKTSGFVLTVKKSVLKSATSRIKRTVARQRLSGKPAKKALSNPVQLDVVLVNLTTKVRKHTVDKVAPFSVYGNSGSRLRGAKLKKGKYKLSVMAFDSLSHTRLGSSSYSFTIKKVAKEAAIEVDPTAVPETRVPDATNTPTGKIPTSANTPKPNPPPAPATPKNTATPAPARSATPTPIRTATPTNVVVGSKNGLKAIAAAYGRRTEFWIAVQDPTKLSAKCQQAVVDNFDGIIPETATRWNHSESLTDAEALQQQKNIFQFASSHNMKVEGNHLMTGPDKIYGKSADELKAMLKDKAATLKAQGMDRIEINEFIKPNAGTSIDTLLKNNVWGTAFGSPDFFFVGIQAMRNAAGVGNGMPVMINDFQGLDQLYNLAHELDLRGLKNSGNIVFGHQLYSMSDYLNDKLINTCQKINSLGYPFNVSELGLQRDKTQAEQADLYSKTVAAYLKCDNLGITRSVGFWWLKDGNYDDRAGVFNDDCSEKPLMNSLRSVLRGS